MTLREAWTKEVTPEDYEAHMARIGQAQSNARLVRDLLEQTAIAAGSRVLIAGGERARCSTTFPPACSVPTA